MSSLHGNFEPTFSTFNCNAAVHYFILFNSKSHFYNYFCIAFIRLTSRSFWRTFQIFLSSFVALFQLSIFPSVKRLCKQRITRYLQRLLQNYLWCFGGKTAGQAILLKFFNLLDRITICKLNFFRVTYGYISN